MIGLNLIIRFFLELALLFFLGYWGFHVAQNVWIKIGLGLGTPIVAAVIWGMFLSPKAAVKISASARLAMEVVLFGFSVITLYSLGLSVLSIIFGVVFLLNRYLLYRLKILK